MNTDIECENQEGNHNCSSLFDCCSCGDNDCGCAYCFDCNACDACKGTGVNTDIEMRARSCCIPGMVETCIQERVLDNVASGRGLQAQPAQWFEIAAGVVNNMTHMELLIEISNAIDDAHGIDPRAIPF